MPATFALSSRPSLTRCYTTITPDVTKLDQAIAKLRIAINKAADNPLASHNAIVLPFVIDTLRRDLGDLIDARAAGSDLRTG